MKTKLAKSLACLAVAILLAMTGACQKLKNAAEEAAGIKQLSDDEIDGMKTDAEWTGEKADQFDFVFGFHLNDKFKPDLGKNQELDISFLPDKLKKGSDTAGKSEAMALLKKMEFETTVKKFVRFEIVSVAKITEENKLYIGGEDLAEFLDDSQRIKKDNNNQEGDYVLVKGKEKALSFLKGNVKLKKADASEVVVGDALVYTDSSPFVTKSGKETGQYLLALLEGSKGNVSAYKKDIVTSLSAPGTPETTSLQIPYAGAIPDDVAEKAEEKAGKINSEAATTGADWVTKAKDQANDLLGIWHLQEANLLFVQPPQNPPAPPKPADNQKPETPEENKPVDPLPPTPTATVMQKPPEAETTSATQIDLGCSGTTQDGSSTLITEGAKFDDYTKYPGWRATGDVRITTEEHDKIFGAPTELASEPRYLDKYRGYCLLTTGDALYQKGKAASPQLIPGPDGQGRTSEMWQKVTIPREIKSIQVRVSFFSQEFPQYVGTQFNDSFFIKFDETPEMIASGNLNDLAGANNPDLQDKVASCKDNGNFVSTKVTCGEWESLANNTKGPGYGELWDIADSTQAPSFGLNFKCMKVDGNGKCYHGFVPPRVICKTLADDLKGKELTLRINVSDAGDSIFDSALAVDSIVFSKEGCGDTELFSGDRASQVNQ